MNQWPTSPLRDLTAKIGSGATPRGGATVYTESGVSLIRSQNVLDNSMKTAEIAHITDEAAHALRGVTVQENDVLINITGDSIARTSIVDPLVLPARVNQHVAIIRANSLVSASYLQRFLVNPEQKARLIAGSDGGTRNALTKTTLEEIQVTVPPMQVQLGIAEVLGALDHKIAMNVEVAQTIESLTHAIYTRGLAGYEMAPLSTTADFVNGKAFTKGASGTGRVVVRIAELNSGLGGSTVYSDAEVEEKHVAHPGDILFAWSGSLTLSRWYRKDAIVNQHIFKVIPKAGYPSWLVYQLIRAKLADFKSIAADKATTMGHIQRHHLDESVATPPSEEIVRMDAVMRPLWQRGLVAEQESLKLMELRDTLLPELMSGRLRVKDAEKQIEEVV